METVEVSRAMMAGPFEVPMPDLDGEPTSVAVAGRRIAVRTVVHSPRVVVFGNLLDFSECEELIQLSQSRLQASATTDDATGRGVPNEARTSRSCFFGLGEFEICRQIEARISKLMRWPVECAEGMQVLRYGPGEQYKVHHDFFDPDKRGTSRLLRIQGQRVGTLIMYLRTPDKGGATSFPFLGLEISPEVGTGVFFTYEIAHPSTRTLHAGKPVIAGEKYVATKWFLDRNWKPDST